MTIGTAINSSQGVISTNGTEGLQVDKNTSNRGFGPYPLNATLVTASMTLTPGHAGVITVSGSSAITLTMPLAEQCAGADFIIRSLSAHAHVITSSQETATKKTFTDSFQNGQRITFEAAVNTSICFKCDGYSFLNYGVSGSITYTK